MHPTFQALLDAGVRIAEQRGLHDLSVNAVVAEAGLAKGTFYVHFADRSTYLVALHRQFHDDLTAKIQQDVEGLPPGTNRLQRGTAIYLGACLSGKAVKAMLLDMRSEPAIAEEVQRRNAVFTELITPDFAALGWSYPEAAARLYVAMVAEAALVELARKQADLPTRQALSRFIGQ